MSSIETVLKSDDSFYKSYYSKIAIKLQSKATKDYLSTEIQRLEKMIRNESLSEMKLDDFNIRLNILKSIRDKEDTFDSIREDL